VRDEFVAGLLAALGRAEGRREMSKSLHGTPCQIAKPSRANLRFRVASTPKVALGWTKLQRDGPRGGLMPLADTFERVRSGLVHILFLGLQEVVWVFWATLEGWKHACEHLEPQIFLVA
jgi:hypothetical protein